MAKGLRTADIALGILVVVGVLVVFALFGPVLRRGARELGGAASGALAGFGGGLAADVSTGPMTGAVSGGGLGIFGSAASPIANNPAVAAAGGPAPKGASPTSAISPLATPAPQSPAAPIIVSGPPRAPVVAIARAPAGAMLGAVRPAPVFGAPVQPFAAPRVTTVQDFISGALFNLTAPASMGFGPLVNVAQLAGAGISAPVTAVKPAQIAAAELKILRERGLA